MADVTNPDLVDVVDETDLTNPDPNGGTALWRPRELDVLSPVADQGYPPAPVDADVFPTPAEEVVQGVVPLYPSDSVPEPDAAEIYVDEQSLGKGSMVPVDPGDPAAGYEFRSPGEFIVTGPTLSIQTNRTEVTEVVLTVLAVYDADDFPNAPTADTTRFYLRVATPPSLSSYHVSLRGRQVVFADDTLTAADRGAARFVTNFGDDFVVVARYDNTVDNGDVADLTAPSAGDTFVVDVQREGSEDVNTTGNAPADVYLTPEPPAFQPNPAQDLLDEGDFFVSQEPASDPIITSGTRVPSAIEAYPAEQYVGGPGLPDNVNV